MLYENARTNNRLSIIEFSYFPLKSNSGSAEAGDYLYTSSVYHKKDPYNLGSDFDFVRLLERSKHRYNYWKLVN